MKTEHFSNRWGIILASLGMAIGAGNIWRFPRIAGQYGGSFIILWLLFLLIWSIPILLAEFSIGKRFRKSVIGSFAEFAGKKYAWMGFFISLCTLGIAFYYSVVTAWALRYLGFSIENTFSGNPLAEELKNNPDMLAQYWQSITNHNWITILLHIFAILLAILFLIRGIKKGLELANKILIPTLFILLILTGIIALNLEGSEKGLDYMFHINPALFADPELWLQALSQSAWSTGAGWGLIMTISAYSKSKEDVTLNTFISGFGNNTASLIAGITILPAVFGLSGTEAEALKHLQAGNQGLTFTVIPSLFAQFEGGQILSIVFFAALFIAALSSLLPMIELLVKVFDDLGFSRHQATLKAGLFCIIFGLPSAYSLEFFNNQDWVWGIGLILSGLFIIFAVFKYGFTKFKEEFIDVDSDIILPNWFFKSTMSINIFLAFFLIISWMSKGYSSDNWNIFDTYSNASILFQWLLVILAGLVLNKILWNKFGAKNAD